MSCLMAEVDNTTPSVGPDLSFLRNLTTNMSNKHQQFEALRHTVYFIIIPVVCALGILGNLLNLIIFGYRLSRQCLDNLERSATAGLIGLAVSDLLFCCVGLPAAFIPHPQASTSDSRTALFAYYYNAVYKEPFMNLFLLTSTWIICLISLERFVVVCKPIRARWVIRVRKTVAIHTVICILAVVMCIPLFMKYRVITMPCRNCSTCHTRHLAGPLSNQTVRVVYLVIWTVFGTFLPLVILAVCNIRLIVELYRSKALGIADPARYCTPRITMVVVGVVVSFLVLVCPSMILEQLANTKLTDAAMIQFRTAVIIANLLQACKFASNFLLYCAVNRQFRENIGNLMRRTSSKNSSETTNRYHMVELA